MQRCQRRTQLVAGQREELILEAPQAALGNVADENDRELVPPAMDRLPMGFKPATRAVRSGQRELHAEGLTTHCTALRGVRGRQRLPPLVLGRKVGIRAAKHPLVGRIGEHGPPRAIDNQDGIAHTGQDRRQPRALGVAGPALRLQGPGQLL